jgi:hypothetical protein
MRRIISVALVVVAMVGCSRKGPPPAVEGGGGGTRQVLTPVETGGPGLESPQGLVYQGRTAPQWGNQLTETRDPATRAQAAAALSRMGKAGYPFLAQGVNSNSDEVRLLSLQAMGKPELTGDKNSMSSLIDLLGNSRNPALRQAAACRLAWYGMDSQRALQPLQRAAKNDPDDEVRRVAAAAVGEIEEFVKTGGKITRGQPLKK